MENASLASETNTRVPSTVLGKMEALLAARNLAPHNRFNPLNGRAKESQLEDGRS